MDTKQDSAQLHVHWNSILFYSILFYSILFYSILFYSILFYSILFYSIPRVGGQNYDVFRSIHRGAASHNTRGPGLYTRHNPKHVPRLPERAGVARVGPDLQKVASASEGTPHTKLTGAGTAPPCSETSAARPPPPPPPPATVHLRPQPHLLPAVAGWSRHAAGAAQSPRTPAHAAFASGSVCEFVRADVRC